MFAFGTLTEWTCISNNEAAAGDQKSSEGKTGVGVRRGKQGGRTAYLVTAGLLLTRARTSCMETSAAEFSIPTPTIKMGTRTCRSVMTAMNAHSVVQSNSLGTVS